MPLYELSAKPSNVITSSDATLILNHLSNSKIRNTIRWDTVSIAQLRKHTYNLDEFEDAIWKEVIDICVCEPYKFHINTWSFVYDEMMRKNKVYGFMFDTDKNDKRYVKMMSKWDVYGLDDKMSDINPKSEDAWFIHLDDLAELIEEDDNESLVVDSEEAMNAWLDYKQDDEFRDEISDAQLKHLEEQVELWLELQADIVRGK